ncbi:pH regulation protein F [Parazoarcus communis]|uniref:pH regulation protein F n=1 Tax=Parazoarcus communis TaxID=41977 RepID=A0A2U8H4Q1_9RHOO|nr:monovalent cation/H+ antiporter complex subunit F [Parazoarcus communis]AWI79805.1 pH regulation protein F [Parazoarcus communis]
MSFELAGAAWVIPLAFALQGVSAALILARLLRGPTGPDRVVAIDALTLLGTAALGLFALHSRQTVILDAAVVLALVSFISTTAFMLMFRTREAESPPAASIKEERDQ